MYNTLQKISDYFILNYDMTTIFLISVITFIIFEIIIHYLCNDFQIPKNVFSYLNKQYETKNAYDDELFYLSGKHLKHVIIYMINCVFVEMGIIFIFIMYNAMKNNLSPFEYIMMIYASFIISIISIFIISNKFYEILTIKQKMRDTLSARVKG